MRDNFPNEVINQVNVSSHVEQWMKSNQSFDATRSLTDETEALNRQTDRHVKQGIVDEINTEMNDDELTIFNSCK